MGFSEVLGRHLRRPDGFVGKVVAVFMNKINDGMNQFTLKQLQIESDDVLLEIGFGNGKYFPDVLKQAVHGKLVGLDYSETMVREAEARFQNFVEEGRLEITQGSVSHIPYATQYFDKVYTVNTIYFWPNPENDMKEIHRVLKEDGLALITFRSRESMEKQGFTKHGFTLYTNDEVLEIAKEAGFKKVALTVAPHKRAGDVYTVAAVK